MSARTTLTRSILALTALQCLVWIFMSFIYWVFQNGLIVQDSPGVVAQAQDAAAASLAAAVLNALALVAFMRGGRGVGLWLMVAVQAADLTSSRLIERPDSLFAWISVMSAVTLILIAAYWWTSRSHGSGEALSSGPR